MARHYNVCLIHIFEKKLHTMTSDPDNRPRTMFELDKRDTHEWIIRYVAERFFACNFWKIFFDIFLH